MFAHPWSVAYKSISSKNIQSDMNYIAKNTSLQLATQAVTDEQPNFVTTAILLHTSVLWFSHIASILAESCIIRASCMNRAGLSKCRARLEALLRDPTQWRVQKILRRASRHNHKNHELCERPRPEKGKAKLVSGAIPLSFTSPEETFHVRSTDMSITTNTSMRGYTQYLFSSQVPTLGYGRPIARVSNEINNTAVLDIIIS